MVNQNCDSSLPSSHEANSNSNKRTEEENFQVPQEPKTPSSPALVLTNKLLGKGSNAEVYLGYDGKTQEKVAIKVVDLQKLSPNSKQKLQREIDILAKLKRWSSTNKFVQMQKIHVPENGNNDKLYISMEYIAGSDLFVLCNEYSLGLPDKLAKQIFHNITLSIKELHGFNICHLDLKLENIMYNKDSQTIKIIDFGFSQFTTANGSDSYESSESEGAPQVLQTSFCGSIHYAAPELLSRVPFDGKKADVWSLGVVLFALLTGHFPFDDVNGSSSRIFLKIRSRNVRYPPHLSCQQVNLLSMMLEKDPARRCTIEDVVSHPYFASSRPL